MERFLCLKEGINLLNVDIFDDILVQGQRRFTDLDHVGRIFLMHPDDASRSNSEGAEPIQSLMGLRRNEDDSAPIAQSEFLEREDEGFDFLFELGATFSAGEWVSHWMQVGGCPRKVQTLSVTFGLRICSSLQASSSTSSSDISKISRRSLSVRR